MNLINYACFTQRLKKIFQLKLFLIIQTITIFSIHASAKVALDAHIQKICTNAGPWFNGKLSLRYNPSEVGEAKTFFDLKNGEAIVSNSTKEPLYILVNLKLSTLEEKRWLQKLFIP